MNLSRTQVKDLWRSVPYLVFLNSFPGFNSELAPLNLVWWSLATEVQFYLSLPLLPLLLRSRAGRLLGCVALLGYVTAYVAFIHGSLRAQSVEGQILMSRSLFGCAPLFAAGVVAAWLYVNYGEMMRRRWSELGWTATAAGDLTLLGVLVGLGYLLRHIAFRGYWTVEFTWPAWHVAEGVLWAVVLLLLLIGPLHIKPILSNRFLRTIGLWSYSIYLIHLPVLYLSQRVLRFAAPGSFTGWTVFDVGRLAVFMGASIAVSSLTYWTIERPFLFRKARLDR